ncbi:MAG: hypothetical protein AAF771_12190 [Pseudomonadota bacterium]
MPPHKSAIAGGFQRIDYGRLNSRQKENYNFHMLAARLAEYGFNCMRLTDDWQGADLIACHIDGDTFLKIQLKGRLTVDKKYSGKGIHVAFFRLSDCFVYPHDAFVEAAIQRGALSQESVSWGERGIWSWGTPPKWALDYLAPFRV